MSRSSSSSRKAASLNAPQYQKIPGPKTLPAVGNLFDIDVDAPIQSIQRIANDYQPIFRLTILSSTQLFVTSVELLNELCDETRFRKLVVDGVEKLRSGAHDALFTAHEGEPNWDIAHRILLPVFGPTKIRDMFPQMKEVADQLCLKWARYGPDQTLDITSDFTRLTLDTIALCGMDYRFNSFYRGATMHPFIASMNRWLKNSDKQTAQPDFITNMKRREKKQYEADINTMRDICQTIVDQRRKKPVETDDLLNALLNKKDARTGQGLSDASVIDNLITFLVAGHETTSGLLSFAFYYMLQSPEAYAKAQKEVDDVVGSEALELKHISQLKYINAILRESLRLMPTAPAFTVGAFEDTVIGGKYQVKKDEPIFALLPSIHRDKEVYGPDAEEWKPERMLDENFEKLPRNAWKPFGSGKRGCIGRAFAWQESLLVMALLLQVFDFTPADPTYSLKIKETLTIKPDGFFVRASLRKHKSVASLVSALSGAPVEESPKVSLTRTTQGGKPISIFYGSNSGTSETLAHRLASDLAGHGFAARQVDALDAAAGKFPLDHPVILLTGTYDGKPPENAAGFVKWVQEAEDGCLKGASFSVFGCGHHDWVETLYKTPILVDTELGRLGARRIAPRGAVDTASEDAFQKLEEWEESVLYSGLGISSSATQVQEKRLKVTYQPPYAQRQGFMEAVVTDVRLLSGPGVAKKAHIELLLPADASYNVGGSLAVLPMNPKSVVQRVLARFCLPADSMIKIEATDLAGLPTEIVSMNDLFSGYIELSQPATPRNIRDLANACDDKVQKANLLRMATDTYTAEIRDKRVSVLELLEKHTAVKISIESFLEMMPILRPRLYSISSSPEWKPRHASLTWSVVDAPAYSGNGRFLGVASNHLLELTPGSILRVSLRSTNEAFRPPTDPSSHPIIMIATGSGLAPFCGFIQDRALKRKAGKRLAPAILFVGCRGPEDDLYREEMDQFERDGVVMVRRAYSRSPSHPESKSCKYVQDRMWADRADFLDLWRHGAYVYVCGGTSMAEAVKEMFRRIVCGEPNGQSSITGNKAQDLFKSIEGRYIAEVFT